MFTAPICGPSGSKIARICALVCFSDVLNTKKRTTNHFYPIHIRDYWAVKSTCIARHQGINRLGTPACATSPTPSTLTLSLMNGTRHYTALPLWRNDTGRPLRTGWGGGGPVKNVLTNLHSQPSQSVPHEGSQRPCRDSSSPPHSRERQLLIRRRFLPRTDQVLWISSSLYRV